MTDTEITIAIAELDGWIPDKVDGFTQCMRRGLEIMNHYDDVRYLTSRDAIIPVIEKVCNTDDLRFDFGKELSLHAMQLYQSTLDYASAFSLFLNTTPRQLCIALLKATGKLKES